MRLRNIGSGFQSDTPESCVLDVQGVARLLNLPVVCAGARRQLREKRLNLPPSQVPATPTGVSGEETSYPGNAVRNGFFLSASLTKRGHVTIRSPWFWNHRRHEHRTRVRHIEASLWFDIFEG